MEGPRARFPFPSALAARLPSLGHQVSHAQRGGQTSEMEYVHLDLYCKHRNRNRPVSAMRRTLRTRNGLHGKASHM